MSFISELVSMRPPQRGPWGYDDTILPCCVGPVVRDYTEEGWAFAQLVAQWERNLAAGTSAVAVLKSSPSGLRIVCDHADPNLPPLNRRFDVNLVNQLVAAYGQRRPRGSTQPITPRMWRYIEEQYDRGKSLEQMWRENAEIGARFRTGHNFRDVLNRAVDNGLAPAGFAIRHWGGMAGVQHPLPPGLLLDTANPDLGAFVGLILGDGWLTRSDSGLRVGIAASPYDYQGPLSVARFLTLPDSRVALYPTDVRGLMDKLDPASDPRRPGRRYLNHSAKRLKAADSLVRAKVKALGWPRFGCVQVSQMHPQVAEMAETFGLATSAAKTREAAIPEVFMNDDKALPYLLRGLCDADGSVSMLRSGSASFALLTASDALATQLADIAQGWGLRAGVYKTKPSKLSPDHRDKLARHGEPSPTPYRTVSMQGENALEWLRRVYGPALETPQEQLDPSTYLGTPRKLVRAQHVWKHCARG